MSLSNFQYTVSSFLFSLSAKNSPLTFYYLKYSIPPSTQQHALQLSHQPLRILRGRSGGPGSFRRDPRSDCPCRPLLAPKRCAPVPAARLRLRAAAARRSRLPARVPCAHRAQRVFPHVGVSSPPTEPNESFRPPSPTSLRRNGGPRPCSGTRCWSWFLVLVGREVEWQPRPRRGDRRVDSE